MVASRPATSPSIIASCWMSFSISAALSSPMSAATCSVVLVACPSLVPLPPAGGAAPPALLPSPWIIVFRRPTSCSTPMTRVPVPSSSPPMRASSSPTLAMFSPWVVLIWSTSSSRNCCRSNSCWRSTISGFSTPGITGAAALVVSPGCAACCCSAAIASSRALILASSAGALPTALLEAGAALATASPSSATLCCISATSSWRA
mmetsp:Transcript_28997/g.85815  ORF Transcript_28997/g.85815 Transcript_28997/m.85815 type:complete len:205 (-) Transcript_28997:678-1292(-)